MKVAQLINDHFSVEILPTEFRYSPICGMYPGTFPVSTEEGIVDAPMNLIDVQYEIHAGKYLKRVDMADEVDTITQEKIRVAFGGTVLFDQGIRTIPYSLYLLIESYRNEPDAEKLALINANVARFPFYASMEGFIMQVSEIV
jgi:hypothetical protein